MDGIVCASMANPHKSRDAMKSLTIAIAALLPTIALAGTAFFVREVQTGGTTKQCVYNYLGNTHVITISNVKLCPLSIEV